VTGDSPQVEESPAAVTVSVDRRCEVADGVVAQQFALASDSSATGAISVVHRFNGVRYFRRI
jgi:hypothetical protein